MPSIPESTRGSITWRLILHAEKNWPQLTRVQVRYHGSFAYVTGTLPGGEQIPLFRLRYGGSAHSFGFAIYSAAHDKYQDAILLTGLPAGTPQEALDTAATVHLAALGHQPPQNLQRGPLKASCHGAPRRVIDSLASLARSSTKVIGMSVCCWHGTVNYSHPFTV